MKMIATIKMGFAVILTVLFVMVGSAFAEQFSAKAMKTADELIKTGPKVAEAAGVKKDDTIVNYCNGIKCWKSPAASALLLDAGYKNVYWLRDGIPGWIKKGYDTAAGKEAGRGKKKD